MTVKYYIFTVKEKAYSIVYLASDGNALWLVFCSYKSDSNFLVTVKWPFYLNDAHSRKVTKS